MRRRDFLKGTAAAIPALLGSGAWGQRGGASANGQITLGCIGLGIHGLGWNMDGFLNVPGARIVAVCDVVADRREAGRRKVNETYGNSDCAMYRDFREVLARTDIDAVVISTPDHWHVLMSVMAARAGKDVFCEKPTLNIDQGHILIDVMNDTGIVYGGGIEDRSVDQYYRMAALSRNGALGKIERILVTLPEGTVYPTEKEVPIPEGLDYDLWLGPARYTPFTPTKLGAQEWRNVWDYSGGKLTDWGAHLIDTAQVAIGEERGGPVSVDGRGEFPVDAMSNAATRYEIAYRYAGGTMLNVKSGGTRIRIEGTEGWVECPKWRAPLRASDPALLESEVAERESTIWPQPATEHPNFIEAVKNRTKPIYPPEEIHRLSTTMHLGNISMRLERPLKWDPAREQFDGDVEAEALRSCPLRAPWTFEV